MEKSLKELQEKGLEMKNLQLFRTALTHSSFIHENTGKVSNERMEYLGDAVLGLIVGEYLYRSFPKWAEGTLSRVRSSLVRESVLAEVATKLNLGNLLKLGRGEIQSGGRKKESILADSFEALLGAVYLDQGLEGARRFISVVMEEWLNKAESFAKRLPDAKTRLQELLQVNGPVAIQYRTEETIELADKRLFRMSLWVDGTKRSEGTGKSKKEAEQAAAAEALSQLE